MDYGIGELYYEQLLSCLFGPLHSFFMNKDLIILRGVSGSGKTTLAKILGRAICSADDYFISLSREYHWTSLKLRKAHEWCIRKCELFMKRNISPIFVANTSPRKRDLNPYYDLAEKYGYRVFSVIVENRHNGKNSHNVPEESLEKQVKTFNIKLI